MRSPVGHGHSCSLEVIARRNLHHFVSPALSILLMRYTGIPCPLHTVVVVVVSLQQGYNSGHGHSCILEAVARTSRSSRRVAFSTWLLLVPSTPQP